MRSIISWYCQLVFQLLFFFTYHHIAISLDAQFFHFSILTIKFKAGSLWINIQIKFSLYLHRWLFLNAYFYRWKELPIHNNWDVLTDHVLLLWGLSPGKIKGVFWVTELTLESLHDEGTDVCPERVQHDSWVSFTEISGPDIFESEFPT